MYYKPVSFFKFILFLLFPLFIFTISTSCTPGRTDKDISRVLIDRPDGIPEGDRSDERYDDRKNLRSGASTTCREERPRSREPRVSVRDLELVDSDNVGEYILKGRCENEDLLVYVTANGYKTSKNPKCDKRRWEITLDLTPLSAENDEIIFHITHDGHTICEEVGVAFLGPKNYIPISPREDYYEHGFYVMKYEAKLEGKGSRATAVSRPKDKPLNPTSYEEASKLCSNNGSRYDMITNAQWQNIALYIEEEDHNWSEGRSTPSDGNALNCGISRGSPQAASRDDDDDCAASSCQSGWDVNRRTHWLNTSERIWDICGNVGEIVKDKYRLDHRFDDYIYNLHSISALEELFGPRRSYRLVKPTRQSNTWNLGYAKIAKGKNLIVRGLPGRDAGIFSVDITNSHDERRSLSRNIGFRCVYNP